jgi:hypothetical protein
MKKLSIVLVLLYILGLFSFMPIFARDVTIGTGTPASCTALEFSSAISGHTTSEPLNISFNCGRLNHDIIIGQQNINFDLTIDGGDSITLIGLGSPSIPNEVIFIVNPTRTLTLENITLQGSLGYDSGDLRPISQAVNLNEANLVVNGVVFEGFNSRRGGAIYGANSTISIDSATFLYNQAMFGGVIAVDDSTLNIRTAYFLGNSADSSGGAILGFDSTITIDNTAFINNSTALREGSPAPAGGAIMAIRDQLTIDNSRFVGNEAVEGGAISTLTERLTITNSSFTNNTANRATAVNAARDGISSTFSMTNVRFDNNDSTVPDNSVVFSNISTTTTFDRLTFTNNTLTEDSSVFDLNSSNATFSNLRMTRNQSFLLVANPNNLLTINTCNILNNTARAFYSADATINNCNLLSNRFSSITPYLISVIGALNMTDTIIFGTNFTPLDVQSRPRFPGSVTITGSSFLLNGRDPGTLYGLMFIRPGIRATIENTRILYNYGDYGIFNNQGILRIRNTLFVNNRGSEISNNSGGDVGLGYSTIIDSDSDTQYTLSNSTTDIAILSNTVMRNVNCIGRWTLQNRNIQNGISPCPGVTIADPLLDPNGLPLTGSPAIDTAGGMCVASDIDMTTRPQGRACDAGAFEVSTARSIVLATPEAPIPLPTTIPPTRLAVNCSTLRLTSPLDGLPNGLATFYWDAANDANNYIVNVYTEQGTLIRSFATNSSTTTVQGDISTANIGSGSQYSWEVQALLNNNVFCTTPRITLFRASEVIPTPAPFVQPPPPQCGNGIQEPGETQNSCPNGF